ncbi:hypothetical protein [Nocardioides sp. SYSU DS0663]|uniref:hypothetical protein n=1 Tax=Nocardioides sp. SYSU DS0663 TaxID=3416445 RepID=UPI003F4BA6A1
MTKRTCAAAMLALAVLATGCGEAGEGPPASADPAEPRLPDGWRWEAYAGVQVGVPGSWGWTNASTRLGQWCVDLPDRRSPQRHPAVGRPGRSTLVGCPSGEPDGSTLIENTGLVVALGPALDTASGHEPATAEGDQAVRRVGDVLVRVNAPPALREQILATVHETEVDANGCAMHLPAESAVGSRPEPAADVTTLTDVTAVAACRYQVPSPDAGAEETVPLLSSLRLEGEPAADVIAAVQAAPVGGGPDNPRSCLQEWSYGDEFIRVQVESGGGRSPLLHLFYSGCDHNGFHDGTAVRALTEEAVRPLVAGANAVSGFSGPAEKVDILVR